MSNFTNALKNGFGSLEEELEAGLLGNDESGVIDNEINMEETDDDTASIKTDADLTGINETDMFDIGNYSDNTEENPEPEEIDKLSNQVSEAEPLINLDDKQNSYDKQMIILEAYNEIWEFMKEWSEFSKEDKKDITGGKDILLFTPIHAMELVDNWKESKKIHIGDVISCNGKTGICVGINIKDNRNNECFLVSNGEESLLYFDKGTTIKTAKHIDIKGLI